MIATAVLKAAYVAAYAVLGSSEQYYNCQRRLHREKGD
jgi:hypothetical protein